ncbi:MAG: hypothetical protein LQ350_005181 [Teloschistes chrysophthalmus]|nr:MAG: hypothetical protein LQ350_005181 [Niorma chrysophthalma]
MSKAAQRNGVPPRRPGEDDEICRVCKSSRYLNHDLHFLVNPECYHKMCDSCVDRIFSTGPAPCPIAGCTRTLRKQRFRTQTFEDLKIEREVDVRRKVAQVFNKEEGDFETLRAYNNYLEEMEIITFNLLGGIDVAATERKLADYAAQSAPSIAQRDAKAAKERNNQNAQQAAVKEQALLNRSAADRASMTSIAQREESHKQSLDALAADHQTDTKVVLKKSTARRTAAEKARDRQRQQQQQQQQSQQPGTPNTAADSSEVYRIEGLRAVVEALPEEPYDPFGGRSFAPAYYTLQPHYDHPWLDKARTDPSIVAGGYDLREYYQRTTLEAFAGLGCFLEEEMGERERGKDGDGDGMVATEGAAMAAAGGDGAGGDDVL